MKDTGREITEKESLFDIGVKKDGNQRKEKFEPRPEIRHSLAGDIVYRPRNKREASRKVESSKTGMLANISKKFTTALNYKSAQMLNRIRNQ